MNKMQEFGEWLRKKREALELTRTEFAKKCGLSESYIRFLEKGERRPKVETLQKLARGLLVGFEEVAKAAGLPIIGMRMVPIISWVSAGKWEDAIEYPEGYVAVASNALNLFALRVAGDSTEPEFHEGEIIVIDPDADWDSGDFVLVRNGKGEVLFKQIKRYGDTWILRPLNPKYPEIQLTEEHEIIGKVIQKIKKY